ncbi:hypothetical protein KAR48_03220 [bacterium]|nr:hypothetical protein [bacterium]
MNQINANIASHQIISDDLAFSAFLRMNGYTLVGCEQHRNKSKFTFDIGEQDARELRMSFINSEFLSYYNELRNLKKLL